MPYEPARAGDPRGAETIRDEALVGQGVVLAVDVARGGAVELAGVALLVRKASDHAPAALTFLFGHAPS